MVTKPNKFKSGDQLIDLFSAFCRDIEDNGYKVVPTQTAFCRWLEDNFEKTDRKTIYNSLNKIFPSIKKDFERLQSDTIASGGMLNKYNATMSIFGLKNWCGWTDKVENTNTNTDNIVVDLSRFTTEEIKAMLDED